VKVQLDMFVTCRFMMTETVGFLLEPYEGKGYHLYQDNYYNSVHQTNELLQKLIRVCGTIRVNRGLPKDMIEEVKMLKKGKVTFRAPKNDPPGRLDGKLKNHKLVRILPTKNDKTPTRKCRVCVCEKISLKKLDFCSVWCSCVSRRLLHTIAQCGVPVYPEGCYTR